MRGESESLMLFRGDAPRLEFRLQAVQGQWVQQSQGRDRAINPVRLVNACESVNCHSPPGADVLIGDWVDRMAAPNFFAKINFPDSHVAQTFLSAGFGRLSSRPSDCELDSCVASLRNLRFPSPISPKSPPDNPGDANYGRDRLPNGRAQAEFFPTGGASYYQWPVHVEKQSPSSPPAAPPGITPQKPTAATYNESGTPRAQMAQRHPTLLRQQHHR